MFSINDTVRYGMTGVCRIVDIEERMVQGQPRRYYVLRPVHDGRSTLFIPTDNADLTDKMVAVWSKRQAAALIAELPALTDCWIEDDRQRKAQYRETLLSADRKAVARIVRTLRQRERLLRRSGAKLRVDDARALRDAERLLCDEFSLALNLPADEVSVMIRAGSTESIE